MAYKKHLFAAGARLFDDAFAVAPALADDLLGGHRYNAACCAALAASGRGEDDPAPDEARARFRAQALAWLRADLTAWRRQPQARAPLVVQAFRHWQADPDLAGVRDEAALKALPDDERKDWQALWAEVDRLLKRAG
jgi:hypothetical protein